MRISSSFVVVSGAPQSSPGTVDSSESSQGLAEEAKKAGLPQQSIENCIVCNGALDILDGCARGDAQCLCGDGLPSKYQSCAQCLVDVGPKTAGLSQEEVAKSMEGMCPYIEP